MPPWGSKKLVRQIPAQCYPGDLEEYPPLYFKEGASINVTASNLDGDVAREVADLTGAPNVNREASIRFDNSRAQEVCPVSSRSGLSTKSEVSQGNIGVIWATSHSFIPEMCVDARETIFSSSTFHIGNCVSPHPSHHLELATAAQTLLSIEQSLLFAEDEMTAMIDQVEGD